MPSVFQRLARHGTASSKQRDADGRRDRNKRRVAIKNASHAPSRPDPSRVPCELNPIYSRLYRQETISSAANKHISKDTEGTRSQQVGNNASTISNTIHNKKGKARNNVTSKKSHKDETKRWIASPRLPIPCNINFYYRTNREKKEGRSYSKLDSIQSDIIIAINKFEAGSIRGRELAIAIIDTLFYRDFMPGDHWDIDSATVGELDVGDQEVGAQNVQLFNAEKEATWDWKDIYSVTSAKALIKISAGSDIFVDEYSYYTAG